MEPDDEGAGQHHLVAKLGQLLGHCDALEQRIQESRRLAGQLLQTALREALAGPGGVAGRPWSWMWYWGCRARVAKSS